MAGAGAYTEQIDALTQSFTQYHKDAESSSSIGPVLPAVGHAFAGSIATASAKALLYPLELVITRLQVQRKLRRRSEAEHAAPDAETEYSGLIDAVKKIHKNEGGIAAFYTGVAADLGKGVADSFLFFLAYTFVRQWEQRKAGIGKHLSVSKELGVGVAAGALAKAVTTPIQNIVIRQQTAALIAARDAGAPPRGKASVREIARQIHAEQGLQGFWNGYSASVVLTLNPAITFAVDNLIRRVLPRNARDKPGANTIFLVAALSKAVATAITYPAMLAKSRAQAGGPQQTPSPNDEKAAEKTVHTDPDVLKKPEANATPTRREATHLLQRLLHLFSHQYALLLSIRKIYQEEGLSGLYSGLEAEVLKGFLQHGLTMTLKDKVHVGVIQMYYLLLKVTRQWDGEMVKAKSLAKDKASEAKEVLSAKVAEVKDLAEQGVEKVGESVKSS